MATHRYNPTIGIIQKEFETIFAVIAVTGFSIVILMQYKNPTHHVFAPTLPSLLATPTPTVLPTQSFSTLSSDGQQSLILKKQPLTSKTQYSFYVVDNSQKTQKLLYVVTSSLSDYSVPFNAWAPDDAYVFVKVKNAIGTDWNVFPINGTAVSNPLTLRDTFAKAYPDLNISDVTGWAGPGLLIVNAVTKAGQQGPSFWFDLSSQSFIQLATKFY